MASNRNTSQPHIFRQTMIVGVLCALVQTSGIFTPIDNWLISRITEFQPPPSRDLAPLLIAIDDPTVTQFGPPPWDLLRWKQISKSLYSQGIAEVSIVDPWENLININAVPVNNIPDSTNNTEKDLYTKLKIPNLLRELPGSEGLPTQQQPPPIIPPFESWDHHLYLPPTANGVVQDLSYRSNAGGLFGRSAFCRWSVCPTGSPMSLPIRPLDPEISLPSISLRSLLQDDRVLSPADLKRDMILGVTAQWRSQLVRLGVDSQLTHWPLAVSAAISTSRQHTPTSEAGMLGDILIIFLCIGLGSILVRLTKRFQVGLFVLALPVAVGLFNAFSIYTNIIHLPIFGMMLAAGLPPLMSALEGRRVAMEFMRRVALLVVEDSFRYGWKSTRVQTHDELFLKLAALTRAQTPTSTLAYIAVDFTTKELHYIGGYGIERNQLPAVLNLNVAPFNQLRKKPLPFRSDDLLGIPSNIAPIRQGSITVGFWIIGAPTEALLPDTEDIMRLTRWLNRHLQLENAPTKQSIQEWLFDRLEAESVAVQELFLMASEERRRQIRTLHTIQVPLMTADIAGSTLFINTAFREFLERNAIDNIRSIRELVFRLFGDEQLQPQMDILFIQRKPITQPLDDATGKSWRLTVQGVHEDGVSNADRILGFVAFLTDTTDSASLQNIQSALVDIGNTQVREALSYVSEHAKWLETKTSRPAAKQLLQNFSSQAEIAFRALNAIDNVGNSPDPHSIQADLQQLLNQSLQEVIGVAKSKGITVDCDCPPDQYVWVEAQSIHRVLSSLLLHGIQSAPSGTTLSLYQHVNETTVSFTWTWKGAGLDAFFVGQSQQLWDEHSDIPDIIKPYVEARRVFSDLHLISQPGEGVKLTFSLPKATGGR